MVKRAPTPPPPDDEPRYLTVACPFPPYADMENHRELVAFVRWLACAMKGEYNSLYAVFHKPSAANMVVIEISRAFPHFRSLLGAHYWSQFLLNPKSNSHLVSRIYFSTYPNGRAVEKAGWKRIFVEDVWFEGWHAQNQIIAYPYPLSSYCEVPLEDPISVETCRPLSFDMFNIRVSSVPPPAPVGSSTWVARKVDNGDTNTEGNHKRSHVSSHSSLAPVILNEDLTKAETARSGTPRTEKSLATDTSGIGITINGGTIPWDFESDGEEGAPCAPAVLGTTDDECENDDYSTNIYHRKESGEGENEKSATSFSVHPLLANRDKPTCPTHGPKCKTKICKDYSSFIRKSNKIQEQEQRRQGVGNGSGSRRQGERGAWVGGRGGVNNRMDTGQRFGKGNGAIVIGAQSRLPKGFSRIDEGLSDDDEDKVYSTAALSDSLSHGSNSALSTQSISSVKSASTSSVSSTSEFLDTPPSKILSMPPTSAWANGNPLAPKRDQPSRENGKNGIFATTAAAARKESTSDKSGKIDQFSSLGGSAVTSPTLTASGKGDFSTSTGRLPVGKLHVTAPRPNANIPEGGRSASVVSWARIASQPPSRSVGAAPYERTTPPSIGRVITSSSIHGQESNAPLTVSWEEIMDKEAEEEEQW